MRQKMKEFGNDLNNRLQVKNLASVYSIANDTEQAAFNSMQFHKKFNQQVAAKRNLVFVSYSHKDKIWFDKIKTFLQPLEAFTQLNVWDDTEILPGQKWRDAIKDALSATKIAVCIVTQNFLSSEFITEDELKYFIEVTEKEHVPIFWIAASSSTVKLTPLSEIQCAHDPSLPLDMQPEAIQNATIADICNKLVAAMKR
jgi:internalin A